MVVYQSLTRTLIPVDPGSWDKAKDVLKSIGLEDRNGNGVVEDQQGHEARFTVLTQRGVGWYERGLAELRSQLAPIGIAIEPAAVENATLIQRMLGSDYEAMYQRFGTTDLDPASELDMWLSSGDAHFWHLGDTHPEPWEAEIDALMKQNMATPDPATPEGTQPLDPARILPRASKLGIPTKPPDPERRTHFSVPPGDPAGIAARAIARRVSTFKNFRFGETWKLQLRGEVFNIFNKTNFRGITSLAIQNFGSTFGTISTVRDPRTIQLGAKLTF